MSDGNRENTREVELPEAVAENIERRLHRTRFQTVDEYAAVALQLLLQELEREGASEESESSFDPEEEPRGTADGVDGDDAIQKQLESLGYL